MASVTQILGTGRGFGKESPALRPWVPIPTGRAGAALAHLAFSGVTSPARRSPPPPRLRPSLRPPARRTPVLHQVPPPRPRRLRAARPSSPALRQPRARSPAVRAFTPRKRPVGAVPMPPRCALRSSAVPSRLFGALALMLVGLCNRSRGGCDTWLLGSSSPVEFRFPGTDSASCSPTCAESGFALMPGAQWLHHAGVGSGRPVPAGRTAQTAELRGHGLRLPSRRPCPCAALLAASSGG